MAKIEDSLKLLLGDAAKLVKDDFKNLLKTTKADASNFIKNQGKDLERYVAALAKKEISKEEFEDLVKGLVSLDKIEFQRLSAAVKVRAQEVANKIAELAIDGLLKMV